MPDTPKCPRHDDTLVHIGDSWLCMQCNYRCNGPAPEQTWDHLTKGEV